MSEKEKGLAGVEPLISAFEFKHTPYTLYICNKRSEWCRGNLCIDIPTLFYRQRLFTLETCCTTKDSVSPVNPPTSTCEKSKALTGHKPTTPRFKDERVIPTPPRPVFLVSSLQYMIYNLGSAAVASTSAAVASTSAAVASTSAGSAFARTQTKTKTPVKRKAADRHANVYTDSEDEANRETQSKTGLLTFTPKKTSLVNLTPEKTSKQKNKKTKPKSKPKKSDTSDTDS